MHTRSYWLKLAAGLLIVPLLAATITRAQAQGSEQTFPETGQTVSGIFWTYWQEHGGLAQQGYPISAPFMERSDLDGQTYRVQYFERAVFEEHPQNNPPFNVLLSQLGTTRYKASYPNGAPAQTANNSAGSRLFPETGKRVGGLFLQYWQEHGGLAQQGYPISEEFTEVSDLNGQPYTVQYFERAVFELHPENGPPHNVLLSQLGKFQLRAKYPNGAPAASPPATRTPGQVAASVRELLANSDVAMNGLMAMKARSTNVTTDTAGTTTDLVEYQFQAPDRQYSKVTSPRPGQPVAVAEEIRIGAGRYRKVSDATQWTASTDTTPYKWPEYNKVYVAEHSLETTLQGDGSVNGVAVKIVRVVVPLANTNTADQYIDFYIASADFRVVREVTTVPALPPSRAGNGVYTTDFYDFNVANSIVAPTAGP